MLLVLAALFGSSVLVASAEVTWVEGYFSCDWLSVTGTATSPYVTIYAYNYSTNMEYFIVVPVTGGTYSGTLTFPLAPEGTEFLLQFWGSLNPYTNLYDSGWWDGEPLYIVDPIACGSTLDNSCTYPLPADAVVYEVPAGAPAFYAADFDTKVNFDLPAGTWKISEFEGDFAKVWIACEASPVWIPRNAVGQVIG